MSEEIIKLQNAAIELATDEIERWTIERKSLKAEIERLKAEVERLFNETVGLISLNAEQDSQISKLERELNHQIYLSDKRRADGVLEGFRAARETKPYVDPLGNQLDGQLEVHKYDSPQDYLSSPQPKAEEKV